MDEEDDDILDDPLAAVSPAEAEKALYSSAELLSKWHNPEKRNSL